MRIKSYLSFIFGLIVSFSLQAASFSERLVDTVTHQVVELEEFYRMLGKMASESDVLKKVKFEPRQIMFGGGFIRKVAAYLHNHPEDKKIKLMDILDSSRDLDLIWVDPEDSLQGLRAKEARAEIMSAFEKHLANRGVRVRNVEMKLVSEVKENPIILKQGYDTPSQAIVGPLGALDLMDIIAPNNITSGEAIQSLESRSLEYYLSGALESTDGFLNQIIEVIRIFKILVEDPNVKLTDTAHHNVDLILTEFKKRQPQLQAFLIKKNEEARYFVNRLADVLGWLISTMGKDQPVWFKTLEHRFGIWEFFKQFPEIQSQAIPDVVQVKINGTIKDAVKYHSMLITQQTPIALSNTLSFDFANSQVLQTVVTKGGLFKKAIQSTHPVSINSGTQSGQITSRAVSGREDIVDPLLLPLSQFVVQMIQQYGSKYIALVKHSQNPYSTLVMLDPSENPAQFLFLNGRSFSRSAAAGTKANLVGAAPMIPSITFDVTNDGALYVMTGDRRVHEFKYSGQSFIITRTGYQAPRGNIVQMLMDSSGLFSLTDRGRLTRTAADGKSELLGESVMGLFRTSSGQVAFVRRDKNDQIQFLIKNKMDDGYLETTAALNPSQLVMIKTSTGIIKSINRTSLVVASSDDSQGVQVEHFHSKTNAEILDEIKKMVADIAPANISASILNPILANQTDVIALTTAVPERGITTPIIDQLEMKVMEHLMLNGQSDGVAQKVAQIIAARLVLELRRGISVDFGFLPNSFVLGRLVKFLEDHSDWIDEKTSEILRPLQNYDEYEALLMRDDKAANKWKDNVIPKWSTYNQSAIKKLPLKDDCAKNVALVGSTSTKSNGQ